jgi:hypothetical protein
MIISVLVIKTLHCGLVICHVYWDLARVMVVSVHSLHPQEPRPPKNQHAHFPRTLSAVGYWTPWRTSLLLRERRGLLPTQGEINSPPYRNITTKTHAHSGASVILLFVPSFFSWREEKSFRNRFSRDGKAMSQIFLLLIEEMKLQWCDYNMS